MIRLTHVQEITRTIMGTPTASALIPAVRPQTLSIFGRILYFVMEASSWLEMLLARIVLYSLGKRTAETLYTNSAV